MIAKISTGSDPKGLAAYLHGPGKATPHSYRTEAGRLIVGGTVIAGSVQVTAKNPTRWGRDFERAAATNARVGKPVWHCSLRCAPGDRRLTDTEFADIAQLTAERMGFAEHPWVAVRHDDDHIHLAVSRVDFQGVTWKNSNDRWKVVEVMREVERTHDLVQVASPERARGRQASSGEQRKAVRTGKVPQRDELREIVTAARDIAAGQGAEAFEQALAANPITRVQVRRNIAKTGRMNGYSFNLPGYTDAAGEPIWLPASKLDRRLSWSQLETVLTGPRPERLAAEEVVPRKRLERAAAWEDRRRVVGAEQFQSARWEQARAVVGEVAGQIRAEQSADTKWKQVESALTSQDRAEKQAAEAARVASAVLTGHPWQVRDMLAAQEQRRKPWTPEQKRQYATAKAQAERAAAAKDAAKWTEVAGGGHSREVRGVNLKLWVSDDGAWSLTSKKDPDRQFVSGRADTVAQAQAAAAARAKKQVQAMWKQVPADKRTESATKAFRRAVADLTPTKPAEVPAPKRPSRPATPPTQGYRPPDQGRTRDGGMSL
ncbi:relaxase/mobilization nuclease domain-containing protein [Rhodococcus pyridinivorans]|uniref:relaxase/mobilization nuclease domain-containing protein n=1 Tax=Rhodococcus pyridinivorans TaxID=103816 RepID=UPI00265A522E|nr:relaxase/mobilization nuclease domain-containing protein [Rhodococcus pyridinivorans]